jgi:hypothetical protein
MAPSPGTCAQVEPEAPLGESRIAHETGSSAPLTGGSREPIRRAALPMRGAAHRRGEGARGVGTTAPVSSDGAHEQSTGLLAESARALRASSTADEESDGALVVSRRAHLLWSRAPEEPPSARSLGSRTPRLWSATRFVKVAPLVVRVSALRIGSIARGAWSGPRRARTLALTMLRGARRVRMTASGVCGAAPGDCDMALGDSDGHPSLPRFGHAFRRARLSVAACTHTEPRATLVRFRRPRSSSVAKARGRRCHA